MHARKTCTVDLACTQVSYSNKDPRSLYFSRDPRRYNNKSFAFPKLTQPLGLIRYQLSMSTEEGQAAQVSDEEYEEEEVVEDDEEEVVEEEEVVGKVFLVFSCSYRLSS